MSYRMKVFRLGWHQFSIGIATIIWSTCLGFAQQAGQWASDVTIQRSYISETHKTQTHYSSCDFFQQLNIPLKIIHSRWTPHYLYSFYCWSANWKHAAAKTKASVFDLSCASKLKISKDCDQWKPEQVVQWSLYTLQSFVLWSILQGPPFTVVL